MGPVRGRTAGPNTKDPPPSGDHHHRRADPSIIIALRCQKSDARTDQAASRWPPKGDQLKFYKNNIQYSKIWRLQKNQIYPILFYVQN